MKKYFLILLAAMALVSCDDMFSSDEVDYSTMTIEELLQTGDGIDYLVKQSKEINFDELNERLKTEVLSYCINPVFILQDGVWEKKWMVGGGGGYMVLMEDNTFRHCYELEHQPELGKIYKTYSAGDNAVVEMVGKMVPWSKIVAYVGDTLVCEYESYWSPTRFLAFIGPWRESVLSEYTHDMDNPQSWMGK